MLIGGLSAVCLDFGAHSPVAAAIPSRSARLLITVILFASSGALVTISPIGRRSGAHLNPAVTLAFYLRRHLHHHDLFGYVAGQCVGAIVGDAAVRWWWGSRATSVADGLTQPRAHLASLSAAGIEAAMTATMVFTILAFVSSARTARFTPLAAAIVVALLVWQGAPYTDTSLNPARSLGPAVVTGDFRDYWIYVLGPLSGAVAAVGLYALVPLETYTAKLFHDVRYRSPFASLLPVRR